MCSGCLGQSALQENSWGFVCPSVFLGTPPQLGPQRVCHLAAEGADTGTGMELPGAPKAPGKTPQGDAGGEAQGAERGWGTPNPPLWQRKGGGKAGQGRGLPRAGQEVSGSRAPALPTTSCREKRHVRAREPCGEWKSPRELPARATLSPAATQGQRVPPRPRCPVQHVPRARASPCTPKKWDPRGFLGNHKEHPARAAPKTQRGWCLLSPQVPRRNLRTSAKPCPGLGPLRDAMGEVPGKKTSRLG